ncbi:MAG: DEAD/DEAH box helicase [Actinomycetes bacterium]
MPATRPATARPKPKKERARKTTAKAAGKAGSKSAPKKSSKPKHKTSSARPIAGAPKNRAERRRVEFGDTRTTRAEAPKRTDRSGSSARSERPDSPRRSDSSHRSERPASRDPRSRDERPRQERVGTDRPRGDRFGSDKPRTERATERPRTDRFSSDRPRTERPYSDRPRTERSTNDRYNDRPRSDRARSSFTDRPQNSRTSSGDRTFASKRENNHAADQVMPKASREVEAQFNVIDDAPTEGLSWADLGVSSNLVSALARGGITSPFPIQSATLPDAIAGRDILGRGQTGSGKTLAFGLAMLTRLAGKKAYPNKPLGLVLVPTRELAMQVNDTLAPLADSIGLKVRLIAGGMPYQKQLFALDRGVPILVATPGRLMDLVNRGACDLSDVCVTVLDEADQMADMGFMPIVREILDCTKDGSQRLLFSATLDGDVDHLVKRYLNNPARHSLAAVHAPVDTMEHAVLIVHPKDKDEISAEIGAREGRTIFFVRTQAAVDRLAEYLCAQGIPAGALHGGKTQAVRTRTLNAFREGVTPALVATDVAARGIHVDGISLVVHVDAPTDPKDYLHRAGRTARAGEEGTVVTLSSPRQQKFVESLTKKAGVDPMIVRVRPGDSELIAITGAKTPTGVPWEPPKERERPSKPYGQGGGRSGGFNRGGPRRSSGGGKPSYSRSRGRD